MAYEPPTFLPYEPFVLGAGMICNMLGTGISGETAHVVEHQNFQEVTR